MDFWLLQMRSVVPFFSQLPRQINSIKIHHYIRTKSGTPQHYMLRPGF